VAVAKSIVLLVRSSADDTVTYFQNLLTSAGLPFTKLNASQINAGSVANAIIIAGFSSEPTEFRSVAGVISTAVENGSWMIAEAFGAYLPAYAGIGTVSTSGYYPDVEDHNYFVKPITASPLFNNVPTWDPPSSPDQPQQLKEYLVSTGTFTFVNLSTVGQSLSYWDLDVTAGWPYESTSSSYCQSWGGCTSQRTVFQFGLQVISQGAGEIMTGLNNLPVISGAIQWGPASDAVYKNFITWASTLSGLQFYPLTPCRVADTRTGAGFSGTQGPPYLAGGTSRNFAVAGNCGVPANATAYSLNVTVVPRKAALGYLTTWPAGQTMPLASTLNSWTGIVVANAALVPAGTNGDISIYASDDTDVLFDINGYFAPPATGLQFYPLTPCRVADTRTGAGFSGTQGPPYLAGGTSRNFQVAGLCGAPSTAAAYSVNVTVVPRTGELGYLTTWPTGQTKPWTSTLNSPLGQVVANAAIVPAGTSGDISIYASDATDVLFDINGYFAPPGTGGLDYYAMTPCRVADTRSWAGFPGQLGSPSMGAATSRSFPVQSSACSVPSAAAAYSFNVTVVPSTGVLNYLTAWPTGQAKPWASTLNSPAGTVVANAALVPAGTGGAISIYVSDPTDVLFDINGYFAPGQ
jgi:hypothetical protein